MAVGRRRLDAELVARGLARSRSQAADLIRRGLVTVAGRSGLKASLTVDGDTIVGVDEDAADHVSRGGEKLEHALDRFTFDPQGRVALDLGASTGGFTEVLLRRGARRVYAVDVGHGQLAPGLRADSRVVNLEGLDARNLTAAQVPEQAAAMVADLSFIAAAKALEMPLMLAAGGAWLVVLVKPQFEVGRHRLGKGGVVRDAASRQVAVSEFETWLGTMPGWTHVGTAVSPVPGRNGNEEWLVGAVRDR